MDRVTIVIPCTTMNDYVQECLLGCLQLAHPRCRVVLLPDEPANLTADLAGGRIVVLPTGRASIGAKRNRAVRAFPDTDRFAFLDSDAYPHPAWLVNGLAAFRRDEAIVAVGGPNLTPPGEPAGQKAVGNALRSFLVSGAHAFAMTAAPSRYSSSLHSCNLIVDARALAAACGFHEGLRTGEDRELCHRLRARGGRVYFSSDVVVYHHNRRPGGHLFLQRLVQGHSIYRIAAVDRDRENLALFVPPAAALAVLGGLLLGFVHRGGWLAAGSLLGVYLTAAAVEAVRSSDRAGEVPLTLAAILTANAGYITGSLLGLFGRDRDLMRLYGNWRSPERRKRGAQG